MISAPPKTTAHETPARRRFRAPDRISVPGSEDDRLEGLEQYDRVQEQGALLDVIQIVLELGVRVLDGIAVGEIDLRPAGDARAHSEPQAEVGDLLFEQIDEMRALGARADDAHLALQDVDELRDLVDARAPEESSHRRYAVVPLLRPLSAAFPLRVGDHRPKLLELVRTARQAEPLLAVEDGPFRAQLHQQGDAEHQRCQDAQG